MWRVDEREIGHVVVVDDGPGQGYLVAGQVELGLEAGEGAIGLVDDEVGVHLGDEPELALADLGGIVEELHI